MGRQQPNTQLSQQSDVEDCDDDECKTTKLEDDNRRRSRWQARSGCCSDAQTEKDQLDSKLANCHPLVSHRLFLSKQLLLPITYFVFTTCTRMENKR